MENCAICFKTMSSGSIKLDCSHEYCTRCIINYLYFNDRNSCPLCRSSITKHEFATRFSYLYTSVWNLNLVDLVEKGVLSNLSAEDLQTIKDDLSITNMSIVSSFSNLIAGQKIMIVTGDIVFIGNVDGKYLHNILVIQRVNGKSYPAVPQSREISSLYSNGEFYIYSVNA